MSLGKFFIVLMFGISLRVLGNVWLRYFVCICSKIIEFIV